SHRLLSQVDGWPYRRCQCRLERQGDLGDVQHQNALPHRRRQGDDKQGREATAPSRPPREVTAPARASAYPVLRVQEALPIQAATVRLVPQEGIEPPTHALRRGLPVKIPR